MSFDRLELLESSSSRLYRPDPAQLRGEQDFRARLFNRLLLGAGAIALEYLVLGLAGFVTGQFFPYDAIALLLVVAACFWLAKRGSTSTALVLLLVAYSLFASSVISHYGIASPAVALLLPSILACGLVGGYFLLTWTLICGVLVVYLGWAHDHFRWSADLVRAILLWWVQLAAVGWLVHLFAGHLGRLLHRYALMVEERNRIARDIHDTLAQGFTGVVVQLNAATEMLSADPTRAGARGNRAGSGPHQPARGPPVGVGPEADRAGTRRVGPSPGTQRKNADGRDRNRFCDGKIG